MGIRSFDERVAPSGSNLRERAPLQALQNATVAIEADHYLDYIMRTPGLKEPLLSAIGGLPFGFKVCLENHIGIWRKNNITPFFVFSGLDDWRQQDSVADAEDNGRVNLEAWTLYERQNAQEAVATFGKSASVKPRHIARFLQTILRQLSVPFTIAPYSAWAQLAYFEKHIGGAVDAIYGASECFLFDCEKLITEWDFAAETFYFVRRRDLVENLQVHIPELFVDALLLSGSAILPTFPVLYQRAQPGNFIAAARDLLMKNSSLRSAFQVLSSFEDEPNVRRTDYIARYQKARMSIKHHLIVTKEGAVQMLNADSAPGDLHKVFGQRLPDELFGYLGSGVVGPRLLSPTASRTIFELPPLTGGETDVYHTLITQDLRPLRQASQGLLSCSLNRWFQRTDINVKCWFEAPEDAAQTLSIVDFVEDRDSRNVGSFTVRAETFATTTQSIRRGLLGITVLALNDESFVKSSLSRREPGKPRQSLTYKDEIMFNTLWRLLLLRGYVDAQHKLTAWGKVLATTLSKLTDSDTRLEESVFLAVELARLNLLTPDDFFKEYLGVPYHGSAAERRNMRLISRVACFSQLEHAPIGFTGPLSRGLLAYHSMICTVRDAMRDLTESCIATLLLSGDASRDRKDYTEMGLDLPFLHHNDCGLGIAVISYLDELTNKSAPTSDEAKLDVQDKMPRDWFPHSQNYLGDLDKALGLFEAIYEGVKVGGPTLFKQHKIWDEAYEWLQGVKPVHKT